MPNVVKIVKGVAKAVTKRNATAVNKKALKAANGPSKAPKGYKADTARRKALEAVRSTEKSFGKGSAGKFAGGNEKLATIAKPAPKNVISKSGRKANTSGMLYKAAKKAK